ncbi:unnamed protein product [Rangifer tarandus platyrhynchus]|uniref:Uncharacterized protein n=1 Tax=Rangifer tarandus platyrhynchus TaxID=3082113 RepID=A0ABN8YYZ1_RANTA|nr:unnamed protein product [Rangifer tarandus platyrhynchus]
MNKPLIVLPAGELRPRLTTHRGRGRWPPSGLYPGPVQVAWKGLEERELGPARGRGVQDPEEQKGAVEGVHWEDRSPLACGGRWRRGPQPSESPRLETAAVRGAQAPGHHGQAFEASSGGCCGTSRTPFPQTHPPETPHVQAAFSLASPPHPLSSKDHRGLGESGTCLAPAR